MSASDRIDELKKRYDENPRRFFAPLANEYRKSGDLEQAISLCQAHLTDQPSNMNGHVVYGQALFDAGRYDEAKGTFETALTLDPENLIALRHLGDIACTNGANDQAREWYKRVLDADPRNDEIIALLTHLEQEAKKAAIGAPIASVESMAPREGRGGDFKPPQVITPLSNAPVANPTPVVPIDSVSGLPTPVVSMPPVPPAESGPSRESIGLMDLAIDFESPGDTPAQDLPGASADLGGGAGLLEFEEISLGTPLESAPLAAAAPESAGDLMMDPFAEPAPLEMEAWEPPVVELTPPSTNSVEAATPEPVRDDGVDMLFGDTLPADPAPPFVTETMAELYLQQGFTAEALDVYKQLSAQFPDDENLKERVRKLERGDRTSLSLDVVPESDAYTAEGAVPLGGMIDFDATPVAAQPLVDDAHAAEPDAVHETREVHEAPRSARSYFAGLATRRAVQGNGRARTAPRVSAPRVSAPHAAAAVSSAPIVPAASIVSLNELFDGCAVSATDEQVALAFAQVAGAVEMGATAVQGKPTAPAATELSLDSVFRGADARGTATVPRQSQTLRFDQFFSTSGEDVAPPQPPAVSAPVGEPGSPAEIKQFQSWLTGLKQP